MAVNLCGGAHQELIHYHPGKDLAAGRAFMAQPRGRYVYCAVHVVSTILHYFQLLMICRF